MMTPTPEQLASAEWWQTNVESKYNFWVTYHGKDGAFSYLTEAGDYFDQGGIFYPSNDRDVKAKRRPAKVWHESPKGLPPAGTYCQVLDNEKWHDTFIVGRSSKGSVVYQCDNFTSWVYDGMSKADKFRPFDPKRDNTVKEIRKLISETKNEDVAEALYNAGFRLEDNKQ